jgi:hypothetical protein
MKTTTKLFTIVALFATVLFASCKKEETANPVASFTISPNDTLFFDQSFTFTNTSTDADSYSWNFGDGTSSTAVSPTKSYAGYDNTDCDEAFTITLTATKNGKTSSTTSKTVLVYFCS